MWVQEYLTNVVFPGEHPEATRARAIDQQNLPALDQKYDQRPAWLPMPGGPSHDAGAVLYVYGEEGARYRWRVESGATERRSTCAPPSRSSTGGFRSLATSNGLSVSTQNGVGGRS